MYLESVLKWQRKSQNLIVIFTALHWYHIFSLNGVCGLRGMLGELAVCSKHLTFRKKKASRGECYYVRHNYNFFGLHLF